VTEDASDDVAVAAIAVARRGKRRRNIAQPGGRTFQTIIRMSPEEKSIVVALAAVQRISVPALFMRAVFTGGTDAAARYERLREELAGARRLLAALGANVNQLARQANTNALGDQVRPVTVAQLEAAAEAVVRAVERVDAITARATPGGPAGDSLA
jgi:hypothetical protein